MYIIIGLDFGPESCVLGHKIKKADIILSNRGQPIYSVIHFVILLFFWRYYET